MNNVRQVFWTGGWDSTFRIIQLSRTDNITIQPVYISGDNRPSEQIELQQMGTISNLLKQKPSSVAPILPIKVVDKKDILPNPDITQAFHTIRKTIPLGSQYEFLARYAAENPMVEIGPECPDGEFSGIVEAINTYGGLVAYNDSWQLDREHATEECKLLFGNFSYPIIKLTERAMLAYVKEWEYEDIMKHIWFCHNPINGKACGLCRPCEQKMDEHMEFLLAPEGQKRYRRMKLFKRYLGVFGQKVYKRLTRPKS